MNATQISEYSHRDVPWMTAKEGGTRINVPQKNLAKFQEVLLYVLNKVGSKYNVGETVLYKLLLNDLALNTGRKYWYQPNNIPV